MTKDGLVEENLTDKSLFVSVKSASDADGEEKQGEKKKTL